LPATHILFLLDELVSHLHLQKQQVFSQQSSPALQNQQIQYTEDSNLRFELEHQMIEIKEQVNSEYKRVEEYRKQLQQEHQSIDLLEKEIAKIKAELEAAKMVAEDAEKILIEEQRTKEFLEASTMDASNLSSSRIENVPDLTRAPSTFSSSSIMSPRSEFGASTATSSSTVFDPFAGFKKMNSDLGVPSSPPVTVQNLNDSSIATIKSQLSLSPVQSKAISMYGFDITAFDALSFNDSNEKSTGYSQKQSIENDLAAIFGAPINPPPPIPSSSKSTSAFDSIFL
jgi:chromosome segregation ATPase